VAVPQQAGHPFGLVAIQPGVDAVRVAGAEQAMASDGVRGQPVGDLSQGGAALTDVRPGVMVTVVQQLLPLGFG
jgi:hypothetical protein